MGAVFGAIVGLPAMRLKHLYLAIATLSSFQMIFEWTINFHEFFNQGQTIYVSRVFWFTGKVGERPLPVLVLCDSGGGGDFRIRVRNLAADPLWPLPESPSGTMTGPPTPWACTRA
jgi:hypothetical protein